MNHSTPAVLGRSLAALAVTAGLGLGVASVAGADSGHGHGRGHDNGGGDHAAGYVMAMTATTLNVESSGGVTTTYTISPTTTYTLDGQAATAALLVIGERVEVQTAPGAPTTAASVNIDLAEIRGLVLSVSGSTVLVIGPEGFTRTVQAGASTVVTSGGQASTLSAITPGTPIVAEGTIDSTGTILDAVSIDARAPEQQNPERASGLVTNVTPNASVTISGDHGASVTYTLTSTTTYTECSSTVPSSDLLAGEHVSITTAAGSPTTAASVDIRPLRVRGRISAVGSGSFSVTNDGATTTVVVEPSTQIYQRGQLATAAVTFTVGEHVVAAGLPDATSASTLDAQVIVVGGGEGWGLLGPGLGNLGNGQGNGQGNGSGQGDHHRGHQR